MCTIDSVGSEANRMERSHPQPWVGESPLAPHGSAKWLYWNRNERRAHAKFFRTDRLTVAMELGTWRCGRSGGAAGSATTGNGTVTRKSPTARFGT